MRALLLLLALLLPLAAEAKHLTFPPFDEGPEDASFSAYRSRLRAAVERRDAEAVAIMASPDIKLSFGDDGGRAQLTQELKDEVDGEWRWQTLERVLKEGGGFRDGLFIAPWSFLYEPPEDLDIYSLALVGGTNVRLRAAPSTEAPIIRALTYEVVEMPPYDANRENVVIDTGGREWRRMRTMHGEEGWVASNYLRFLLDYRAGFQKTAQGWQMVFFLAGD